MKLIGTLFEIPVFKNSFDPSATQCHFERKEFDATTKLVELNSTTF
jgi:hypothetical protein